MKRMNVGDKAMLIFAGFLILAGTLAVIIGAIR